MTKKILILGNVGSGKTTLIRCIRSDYNLPYISTGNIVRNLLENDPKSPTSQELKFLIDNKLPFNEGLIVGLLKPEIMRNIATGFIIDGFPKNPNEANELQVLMNSLNIKFDHIFNLQIELLEVLKRLESRVICQPCNISGSLEKQVFKKNCDNCGVEMERRKDDEIETIKARYEYMVGNETAICDNLEKLSQIGIENIDCNRTPREIYSEIKTLLYKL